MISFSSRIIFILGLPLAAAAMAAEAPRRSAPAQRIHNPPTVRIFSGSLVAGAYRNARARKPRPDPALDLLLASAADQVRRCYRPPRVASSARQIGTRLLVRFGANGRLADLPLVIGQTGLTQQNGDYAERMAEAARLAVIRCSPIQVPELARGRRLDAFELLFSPRIAV